MLKAPNAPSHPPVQAEKGKKACKKNKMDHQVIITEKKGKKEKYNLVFTK